MLGGRRALPSSAGRSSSSGRSWTHVSVVEFPHIQEYDALVEDQEALQHLQLVLVRHSSPDLVVQLLISERLLSVKALVRKRRHKLACLIGFWVVCHGEVDVEQVDLRNSEGRIMQ